MGFLTSLLSSKAALTLLNCTVMPGKYESNAMSYPSKPRVRSTYPENPCSSYGEWAQEVLGRPRKMRTEEYVKMLNRER